MRFYTIIILNLFTVSAFASSQLIEVQGEKAFNIWQGLAYVLPVPEQQATVHHVVCSGSPEESACDLEYEGTTAQIYGTMIGASTLFSFISECKGAAEELTCFGSFDSSGFPVPEEYRCVASCL